MPVQLTVKVSRSAEIVRQGLQDLGAEIPKIGRKGIYDAMVRVRGRLRRPAPKPSYPIQWDSQKQRRYVMAMLREQGNIPYRRTGRYQNAWEIQRTETGYMIYNTTPQAKYIGGDYEAGSQSRIHQGRWPLMQDEVEKEVQELPPEIERNITYYARGKGL